MMNKLWLRKLISIGSRLNYLHRWAGTIMLNRQTVAEHAYNVTLKAHILGMLEENIFKQKIDWKKLFIKAYSHDLPEGLTGDIIAPTKKFMKEDIDRIEEIMFNNELGGIIPEELYPEVVSMFKGHKDGTLEGNIVHAADLLDALEELLREYSIKYPNYDHNKNSIPRSILLDPKIDDIIQHLKELNLNSVNYILEAYMESNINIDKQENNEGMLKLGVMQVIKCRNCGGKFEGESDNTYTCPYCLKSFDIEPIEG